MRVDNGRLKAFVSQELLNVPERCAAPEQVSRATVAEGVNGRREFGGCGVILDDFPDLRIRQTLAGERKPERRRVGDDALFPASPLSPIEAVHYFHSRSGDVFFYPTRSVFRQRRYSFASAFAFADSQGSPVEVADVQLKEFAVPDAGRVESF